MTDPTAPEPEHEKPEDNAPNALPPGDDTGGSSPPPPPPPPPGG